MMPNNNPFANAGVAGSSTPAQPAGPNPFANAGTAGGGNNFSPDAGMAMPAPKPELPFMAEAIDAKGQPYYGEGLKGWARKTYAKIFDPKFFNPAPTKEQASMMDAANKKGTDQLNRMGWDKWVESWTGISASDVTQTATALATGVSQKKEVDPLTGEVKLVEASGFEKATGLFKNVMSAEKRGLFETVWTGLDILSLGDKASRKVQTWNVALDEIGDTSAVLPDVTDSGRILKTLFGDTPTTQRLSSILDAMGDVLNPVAVVTNIARAATAPGTLSQKWKTVTDTMQGSNMVYTMYWDAAKKQEYMRRVQAGENPDLLVAELENSWVELGGSIIGDPTTYLGMGVIGDFGKAKTAVKIPFTKVVIAELPWRTVGHIPGFTELLGLKNIGKARLASAGDEFVKLADPALEKVFQKAGSVEDEVQAVAAVRELSEQAVRTVQKYSKDYGIVALESTAKADVMKKSVGGVFGVMTARWRNFDDMADTFNAYKALRSGDTERAYEALSHLKEMYGPLPFSQAGLQAMEFFTKLADDVGGKVDELKALAQSGNKKAAIEKMEQILYAHVDDAFPSVNDMEEAYKAVKAAGTGSEKQLKLAEAYKDLQKTKPAVIWTNAVNNKIAGSAAYQGLQRFFANVFMGASPAYALRNLQNNTFTIWHDLGSGAAGEALEAGLSAFGKSVTDSAAAKVGQETGLVAKFTEDMLGKIRKMTGGVVPYETVKGIGQAGMEAGGFIKVGQDIEKMQSAVIVRNVLETEMEKMLRYGGLPSVEALEKVGFPPEQANRLYTLAIENYGDTKAAMTAFRNEIATGHFEGWRHLELDANFKDWLKNANLYDELDDIRKTSGTAAEFMDRMEAFGKKIEDIAQRVADEPALVSMDNPMGEAVAHVEKAFEEAGLSSEELNNFRAMTQLNDDLRNAYSDVGNALRSWMARELPDPAMVKEFDTRFNDLNGVFGRSVASNRNMAIDFYEGAYKESKKGVPVSELWKKVTAVITDMENGKPVMKRISIADTFPDVDPDLLPPEEFRSMAWRWIKDQQNEFWRGVNQDFMMQHDAILNDMASAAGKTLEEVKIDRFGDLSNPQLTRVSELGAQVKQWMEYLDYEKVAAAQVRRDVKFTDQLNTMFETMDQAARKIEPAMIPDVVEKEKAIATKVKELPKTLRDAFQNEARAVRDMILGGEPGKRIFNSDQSAWTDAATGFMGSTHSTYPKWYNELQAANGGRKGLLNSLERIIKGEGDNTAVGRRLKEFIVERWQFGDNLTGQPPDLYLLQSLGLPKEKLDNALDLFNEMTGKEYTLEEASALSKKFFGEMPQRRATKIANLGQMDLTRIENWQGGKSRLFNAVNKDRAAKGLEAYKTIDEVPFEEALASLKTRVKSKPIPPYVEGSAPTVARQLFENWKGGAKDAMTQFVSGTLEKWGEKTPVTGLSDEMEEALSKWVGDVDRRMVTVRASAMATANETRNFILHDYNKNYLDKFLGYFLQYHYWPSRTYMRWAERAVDTPGVLSAYAKYHEYADKAHADMPEWWRYNVPVGKLLGMKDNPMYLNLEATLNPLNGLTGTDFNDPAKRVDWLSSSVDDMNQMGFNMAVPLQWAMALKLYSQGKDDAGRRWMGRLLPFTTTIKAGVNKLYEKTGIDLMPDLSFAPGAKYGEFDPFVNMMSKGVDPYEEKRVNRAMAAIISENPDLKEKAYDQLYNRQGDLYDQAVHRAINERAPGQLASFFLGLGYKTRNEQDMQVDKFYSDYSQLLAMRNMMSPDNYKKAYDTLMGKYPFSDALLLGKRGGDDRDAAYAYNVLSRLPPGDSFDVLQASGIREDLINKFYQDKGNFSGWSPQDKERFMSVMLDLGATFAMPDGATRAEWTSVKTTYQGLRSDIEKQLGVGIWDKVNTYYDLLDTDKEGAAAFKEAFPEIAQAQLLKQQGVISNPQLYAYYGSLNTIESYYSGSIRAQLADKFGEDITNKQAEYYSLGVESPAKARAYLNAHPEIRAYWKEKKLLEAGMNTKILQIAASLPEQAQGAQVRNDFVPQNTTQQDLFNSQMNNNGPSWDQVSAPMSEPLKRRIMEYWQNNGAVPLPKAAIKELQYIAKSNGYYNEDDLLRQAGFALLQGQQGQAGPPPPQTQSNPFAGATVMP